MTRKEEEAALVRRCGELACQRDSHLKRLRGVRVISCCRRETGAAAAAAAAGGLAFDVVVSDTVIFPEGGGQPSDAGVMRRTGEASSSFRVVSVENRDGLAVHTIVPSMEGVDVFQPLREGDLVDVEVDWQKRRDHMMQHSAQHLITACALELFRRRTIGWSLGESVSYIELEPAESAGGGGAKRNKMAPEQLSELETRVREHIQEDRAVSPRWLDSDSDEMVQIRESMRARGAPPIPAGVDGPLRLITIDSLDACTCCGTHVKSLRELNAVSILHAEPTTRSSKVFFVAGDRVLKVLGRAWAQQRALTALLTVQPTDHLRRCEELLSNQRASAKLLKHWQAKSAKLEVESMILRLGTIQANPGAAAVHSEEGDKNYVSVAASTFVDAATDTLGMDFMLLITAGATGNNGFYAIVGNCADRVRALEPEVSRVLNGRGGWAKSSSVFQGKCSMSSEGREQALAVCLHV